MKRKGKGRYVGGKLWAVIQTCDGTIDIAFPTKEQARYQAREWNRHIYPKAWKVVPIMCVQTSNTMEIKQGLAYIDDTIIGIANSPITEGATIYESKE